MPTQENLVPVGEKKLGTPDFSEALKAAEIKLEARERNQDQILREKLKEVLRRQLVEKAA